MGNRCTIGAAALLGAFLVYGPAQADTDAATASPADDCMIVAGAKFEQWRQPRVLIHTVKTYSNGSSSNFDLIVTPDTAYVGSNGLWGTGNVTIRQRVAQSPQQVLANMQLGQCEKDGDAEEAGQATTKITYRYLPDKRGFIAHGAIWISNATGLPVREDMEEGGPPASHHVAASMTAGYKYNADVQIPAEADHQELFREFLNREAIMGFQSAAGTSSAMGAVGGGKGK